MPSLDPILYANGALRLTRHGPRGGGNVLVYDRPDGHTDQCEIADDKLGYVDYALSHSDDWAGGADSTFDVISVIHAIPGTRRVAPRDKAA